MCYSGTFQEADHRFLPVWPLSWIETSVLVLLQLWWYCSISVFNCAGITAQQKQDHQIIICMSTSYRLTYVSPENSQPCYFLFTSCFLSCLWKTQSIRVSSQHEGFMLNMNVLRLISVAKRDFCCSNSQTSQSTNIRWSTSVLDRESFPVCERKEWPPSSPSRFTTATHSFVW